MKLSQNRLRKLDIPDVKFYIAINICNIFTRVLNSQYVYCQTCQSYVYDIENDQMRWHKKRFWSPKCQACKPIREKENYRTCSHCKLQFFTLRSHKCPCCGMKSCYYCQQPIHLFTYKKDYRCPCRRERKISKIICFILYLILMPLIAIPQNCQQCGCGDIMMVLFSVNENLSLLGKILFCPLQLLINILRVIILFIYEYVTICIQLTRWAYYEYVFIP